ncbi:LemA family protein [Candidatus Roizmanbacteria bacterium]|nr:LemA family protein [Candidatus Roizmanbacteria bacterium]
MNKLLLISGGVILILGIVLVGSYNNLISKGQAVESQWAQVETQYQRRFDLIPNLVKSVEGAQTQERAVFGEIANARANYSGAKSVDDKAKAASQLESALSRLLVIVESYPQLQSNSTVQQLMDELSGTENRISVERRRYNDTVKDYNLSTKTLPSALFASLFGYREKAYFQATEQAAKAPEVNINSK